MLKLKASYIFFLTIFLTTVTMSAANGQTQAFDEGFLQGIKPAMAMMTDNAPGYGDINYHMRTFAIRRNMANQIAQGIYNEAPLISNPLLRVSLEEIVKDIWSAPQGGYGDLNYHVGLENQQMVVLVRVSEKVATLTKLVVQGETIVSAREIGYLKGLRVAVEAMTDYTHGSGDLNYHMRTFEIRRNMANQVAWGITSELENISNPLLRVALSELAKDIRSAPQGSYGDVHHHVAMLELQNSVLVRVSQKLDSLLSAVKSTQSNNSAKIRAKLCPKMFAI